MKSHLAHALRVIEAVNERDVDAAAAMLHPDYEAVWPHARLGLHEAILQEVAMINGFPDLRFDVVLAVEASDGVVVVDATVRGTHTGDLVLPHDIVLPATSAHLELPFQFVMFFEGGLLRRETLTFDFLTMLDQLGALDAVRSPSAASL